MKIQSLGEDFVEKRLGESFVDKTFAPAAIGYCFGGMAVLECIRGGWMSGEWFLSMVCCKPEIQMPQNMAQRYHRKLCENHYNTKAVVLIENGAADYLGPRKERALC